MRRNLWFLVCALFLAFLVTGCGDEPGVVTRGTTNFDILQVDTVTATQVVSTNALRMGSSSLIKTMIFYIDSVGQDQTVCYFVLERGITVLRADVSCQSAAGTDTLNVILRNGATAVTVNVPIDSSYANSTTDASFSAATVCSLFTEDQTSGVGGGKAIVVITYTDY